MSDPLTRSINFLWQMAEGQRRHVNHELSRGWHYLWWPPAKARLEGRRAAAEKFIKDVEFAARAFDIEIRPYD